MRKHKKKFYLVFSALGVLGFLVFVSVYGCVNRGVNEESTRLTTKPAGGVPTGVNFYRKGVQLSKKGKWGGAIDCFRLARGEELQGMPTPQKPESVDVGIHTGEGNDVEYHYFPNRELGIAYYRRGRKLRTDGERKEARDDFERARNFLEKSLNEAGTMPSDRASRYLALVQRELERKQDTGVPPAFEEMSWSRQMAKDAPEGAPERLQFTGRCRSHTRIKSVMVNDRFLTLRPDDPEKADEIKVPVYGKGDERKPIDLWDVRTYHPTDGALFKGIKTFEQWPRELNFEVTDQFGNKAEWAVEAEKGALPIAFSCVRRTGAVDVRCTFRPVAEGEQDTSEAYGVIEQDVVKIHFGENKLRLRFPEVENTDRLSVDVVTQPRATQEKEVVQTHSNQTPDAYDDTVTTEEDTRASFELKAHDPDEDDALEYSITSRPKHGELTGSMPELTYVPNKDYHGEDKLTFAVSDGKATSDEAEIDFDIKPVNDAPRAPDGVTTLQVKTKEDAPKPVKVELEAEDPEGEALTWEIIDRPGWGTAELASDKKDTAELRYAPQKNFNGKDRAQVRVSDPHGAGLTFTVNITVKPQPDPPVAHDQTVSFKEEQKQVKIQLKGEDPDGDSLTYNIVESPEKGTLKGEPPTVFYVPEEGTRGQDQFTFSVDDGMFTSSPAKVSITEIQQNASPRITTAFPEPLEVPWNKSLSIEVEAEDKDVAQHLKWYVSEAPENGTVTFDAKSDGGRKVEVTYKPETDFRGEDRFSLKTFDNKGADATVAVPLVVVSRAPEVQPLTVKGRDDRQVKGTLKGTDPDGDSLVFEVTQEPANGKLEIRENGAFSYDPGKQHPGTDKFKYRASDGSKESNEAEVKLLIDRAPQIILDGKPVTQHEITYEGRVGNPLELDVEGRDPDGDPITWEVRPGVFEPDNLSGETMKITIPADKPRDTRLDVEAKSRDRSTEVRIRARIRGKEPRVRVIGYSKAQLEKGIFAPEAEFELFCRCSHPDGVRSVLLTWGKPGKEQGRAKVFDLADDEEPPSDVMVRRKIPCGKGRSETEVNLLINKETSHARSFSLLHPRGSSSPLNIEQKLRMHIGVPQIPEHARENDIDFAALLEFIRALGQSNRLNTNVLGDRILEMRDVAENLVEKGMIDQRWALRGQKMPAISWLADTMAWRWGQSGQAGCLVQLFDPVVDNRVMALGLDASVAEADKDAVARALQQRATEAAHIIDKRFSNTRMLDFAENVNDVELMNSSLQVTTNCRSGWMSGMQVLFFKKKTDGRAELLKTSDSAKIYVGRVTEVTVSEENSKRTETIQIDVRWPELQKRDFADLRYAVIR